MTLQTKFNLSKLGKEGAQDADCTAEAGSPRSVARRELNPLYVFTCTFLIDINDDDCIPKYLLVLMGS